MKNLFLSTQELDKNATKSFNLPAELLMENAASGMYYFIKNRFLSNPFETTQKSITCLWEWRQWRRLFGTS